MGSGWVWALSSWDSLAWHCKYWSDHEYAEKYGPNDCSFQAQIVSSTGHCQARQVRMATSGMKSTQITPSFNKRKPWSKLEIHSLTHCSFPNTPDFWTALSAFFRSLQCGYLNINCKSIKMHQSFSWLHMWHLSLVGPQWRLRVNRC